MLQEKMWPTPKASDYKVDVNDNGEYAERCEKAGFEVALPQAVKLTTYQSTSSPVDSPASLFPALEREMESKTTDISGRKCLELYELSSRHGSLLKTCVAYLVSKTGWFSSKCVLTWKTQDTKFNRLLFLLSPSTRTTDETESGLWATPCQRDHHPNGMAEGSKVDLGNQVKLLPTPTGQDAENDGGDSQYERNSLPLNAIVKEKGASGSLNPNFVEWLMMFPKDWTKID